MARDVVLRARLVSRLLAYAQARGLDAAALAERSGIPPGAAAEEEPLVSLAALRRLSASVQDALGDPLLGVHLAAPLGPADYGALGFLARSAATLREALELFVGHATELNAAWSVTLERGRKEALVRQRIPQQPESLGPVGNTYFLCGLVVIARTLAGAAARPTRAWLAHGGTAPAGLAEFLGCEVELGRGENGLAVPEALLAAPLASVDPALATWLRRMVERRAPPPQDPLADLRRLLREALPQTPSLVQLARTLAQSPRTLQRRLAEERTTFNAERDRARNELARELVAAGLPLQEVSWRTGYADPRAFSRAFRRWTGHAPGAAQRASRGSR